MHDQSNNDGKSGPVRTKQVFIIGSKRSGTTWLLWLLANHPSIVGLLQTDLIETLRNLEKWWLGVHKYHKGIIAAKEESSLEKNLPRAISYERRNLNDCLTETDLYNYCRDIADKVYTSSLQAKPGAKVVVESQPENIEYLDLLFRMYPDACFLHIIRDPRSVFCSWKNVSKTWSNPNVFSDHPASFSRHWRKDIENGRVLANKPQNYREVHYESMLENGVQELSDIYKWLELDSNPQLAENALDACDINKLRKNVEMPKGFFRKGKKQGWKNELSSSEIKIIEYLLSDLMEELGYGRSSPSTAHRPLKLVLYDVKIRLITAIKNGLFWNLLRGIKRRFLATGT